MHTSPTPQTCALTIIRDAELSELPDIKESITTSLLADIAKCPRRPPTGDTVLDEVRGWVDELRTKIITGDRLRMLKVIVARQQQGDKPIVGRITDQMIEIARQVQVEELYNGQLHQSGSKKWGKCPFHNEKTGSFCIHADGGWSCFGECGTHGDSIDFYMKLHKVNFVQAVKALSIN